MTHLSITVWPLDYMKSELITMPFTHMGWTDGPNRKIAQFALLLGSPIPNARDKKAVYKELNKYKYPENLNFEQLRRKDIGKVKQIDPQFAIKVIPYLDIPDFDSFVEFTEEYGALQIDYCTFSGITKTMSKELSIEQTFIKTDRGLGSVIEYSEETVLLMMRDLKAMAKHIIALSNSDDETKSWIEAGYEIPKGKIGISQCREMLRHRMNAGLKNFHLFPYFTEEGDSVTDKKKKDDVTSLITPGIYSIICFQLYTFNKLNKPISQCAHELCRSYFTTTTGYGDVRSNRTGSRYCSYRCTRNAAQQRYRNKQKVMKQK